MGVRVCVRCVGGCGCVRVCVRCVGGCGCVRVCEVYVFSASPYITCLMTSFISGCLQSSMPKYLSQKEKEENRRGRGSGKKGKGGSERNSL